MAPKLGKVAAGLCVVALALSACQPADSVSGAEPSASVPTPAPSTSQPQPTESAAKPSTPAVSALRAKSPKGSAAKQPSTDTALPALLRGVNLAGAEFGPTPENGNKGTFGKDWIYPTHAEVDHFIADDMNTIRLPFRWERLQPTQFGEFDSDELARLDDVAGYITAKKAVVVIDPHNYSRYYNQLIGSPEVPSAAFADFWSKLSAHFANNPLVVFGLMNEPTGPPAEQWLAAANEAIAAIRATGAKNLITVPGVAWTNASEWTRNWYGTPNSDVMGGIVDSGNNFVIEVHSYLDEDASGTHTTCVAPDLVTKRIDPFVQWAREHHFKAWFGEFSFGDNDNCRAGMSNLLAYWKANSDVAMGWAAWAAGPWWNNFESLEPNADGSDKPQMALLRQALTQS